ncbi:hypothetical protein HA402_002605 [Bradysia odoriphaga]|nr:hypothetical protein HA402_002605 [Bradysia odoriphaga]
MDRVIKYNLMEYLERNGLIHDSQYGFRSKRSTGDVMAYLTETWSRSIHMYGETKAVALDFSKAFDRVWHVNLLRKLSAFGTDPSLCRWIESFLADRSIQVVLDGAVSERTTINAGVPQGSVISPVLFLIYINDLLALTSNPIHSFADDSTLHHSYVFDKRPTKVETNVMDYFSEKTNPFYDRTCNNEIVKMQRQSLDQLNNMNGIEYILLHVQGPILYVIRKQHRHSPSDVTPIADYCTIAGTVYQAPDLASVFNSRLLSITHHLQGAFEEASSYSRYHLNKGYTWDFSSNKARKCFAISKRVVPTPKFSVLEISETEKTKSQTKKETDKVKEEPSSLFQRQRVDLLLNELLQKFPLPMSPQQTQPNANPTSQSNGTKMETNESTEISVENIKQEIIENPQSNGGTEIKSEPLTSEMKPPPEKKMK